MPCIVTAPTEQECNDLSGGLSKLEFAPWTSGVEEPSLVFVEFPLMVNSSYAKQTPTITPDNNTSFYTFEVYFKINGLANFTSWEALTKAKGVFRATTNEGTVKLYGLKNGMSFSAGEELTGQNLEDHIGSVNTFSGVSPVGAIVTTI